MKSPSPMGSRAADSSWSMIVRSPQSFEVHGAGSSGSESGLWLDGVGFGGESLARHPAGEGPE